MKKSVCKIIPILWLSFLLTSCSNPCISDATEFGNVIESFSPSRIPSGGIVKINFTSPIGPIDSIPHKEPRKLFRFKPSIEGETFWTNEGKTLEFHPRKESFSNGREYYCTLETGKLIKGKKDFTFKFKIIDKECRFSLAKVNADFYARNPDYNVVICCRLVFSEPVSCDKLGDYIHCRMSQPYNRYIVNARKITDTEYDIRITGFKREASSYKVDICFDAEKIGFKAVKDIQAEIPANEFKITKVELVNSSNPYFEINFSNRMDENQDLTGLISVDETDDISIQRERSSVKVFLPTSLGASTLRISKDVRSRSKATLGKDFEQTFIPTEIVPQVEIPLSGNILPDGSNLTLPFKAVNLRAVDVSVVKIYTDNVLQFLQENELEGNDEMRRVGRMVYRKTARLDGNASLNLHLWNNFTVDLSGMIRKEKGALYQIRLSFKKEYSLYGQDYYERGISIPEENGLRESDNEEWDKPCSYYYYDDRDGNEYYWGESDDPTKQSYYMTSQRFPKYNLSASNIGLIVKSSDKGRLWTTVSDLMTTSPMEGVKVTAYNYQLRRIGSGVTDENGFSDFDVNGQAFVVTATAGGYTTYLKITPNKEKSLSRFDVGGKKIVKGVKGYAYGERGVWRPGDTLHVSFILEDKNRVIPQNHPVEMTLKTPQGQYYDRYIQTSGKDGFYIFTIPTHESDPTGTWKAEFNVAGSTFKKDLRIETVKPNRIKINFSFSGDIVKTQKTDTVKVESHWLTGPEASGMETSLEMSLNKVSAPFKGYEEYIFDNPISDFEHKNLDLGRGTLDSLGKCSIPVRISEINDAPGMLNATVSCRVEEPGGGFSISSKLHKFSPYSSYAGIKLSEKELETDKDLAFPVICIDESGKLLSGRELQYKIYKLNWRWWWESSARNLDSYINSNSAETVDEGTVKSDGIKSVIHFQVDYPSYGKYLILVKDVESGHFTGGTVYIDWPLWRGHSDKSAPTAISMLSFSTDKKSYEVGETVKLYLPAAKGGRALVSLENASGVISRVWVTTSDTSETVHRFTVSKAMSPNFYLHVSLLQAHKNTTNDLPIRMYGVQNVTVTDKNSYLYPVIDAPEEIEPGQPFTVKVREQKNRAMTYTLAIVDEGLLGLTSFRTPDARATMNEREALGVKTWDIYDDVIGAYTGSWSKVLSIGGDENLRSGAKRDNRFKPIVEFYGPFSLQGGTASHRIKLPMYVGSVRIMLVAGHAGAYGNAEKTMAVRSPLMLVPTLPRTLLCGETVKLPVNVFATEDGIGEVKVDVKVNGPLKLKGHDSQSLSLASEGDGMVCFGLKADDIVEGTAEVVVTAGNGRYSVTDKLCINVSNPNAPVVTLKDTCLSAGSSATMNWSPFKAGNREGVSLEIASFPAISFTDAFTYVQNYRYLCTEQLSSMGMYLLYGGKFLNPWQQTEAKGRLMKIINELYARQLSDGGFSYWPGHTPANEWATSMAGQVLIEAGNQGLSVSKSVVSKWKEYQKKMSKTFKMANGNLSDLQQAYRLYTLAISGDADVAAMNRLKENSKISYLARMRLAAAYAVAGKITTAKEIYTTSSIETTDAIDDRYYTFQDDARDNAMILETLVLLGEKTKANRMASDIAKSFSLRHYGTQELAFTSLAIGRLEACTGTEPATVTIDGENLKKNVCTKPLNAENGRVDISNTGRNDVYIRLVERNVPAIGTEIPAMENGISVSIRYTDVEGNNVIPSRIRQGTVFYVSITVTDLKKNYGERNMALTFPCPSGWEIWNDRLFGGTGQPSSGDYTYRDIRDDKVQWFFTLGSNKKKTFRVKLIASYEGEFYGAPIRCEDMYDCSYYANSSNFKTAVTE